MADRKRTVRREIALTQEEWEMVQVKMAQIGTNNFSAYARKMLIDGYVFHRDFSELKALTKTLSDLARSINQIALRANETRNIYEQDIEDIRQDYLNVKRAVTERLVDLVEE